MNRYVLAILLAPLRALCDGERGPAANTDWFCKAGYGLFVHYLNGIGQDSLPRVIFSYRAERGYP